MPSRALLVAIALLLASAAVVTSWYGGVLTAVGLVHNADRNPFIFWAGFVLLATGALFAVGAWRAVATLWPRGGPPALAAVALLVVALPAAVGVRTEWQSPPQPPPLDRWAAAAERGDYAAAEQLLVPDDAAPWRAATEQVRQQHGALVSAQRHAVPPPGRAQRLVMLVRFTWEDGYARCLRVEELPTNRIDVLDGDYQECASLPPADHVPPSPVPASALAAPGRRSRARRLHLARLPATRGAAIRGLPSG